ncbi:hypothetical protein SHI21_18545 [Bacteriovorax sp. PP10]|uniref:MotA/TolQ/ExbB proton channel domain-containing protein n=1 Tax=Bacteriovorax antarcticus TaxID=3088717 RepID=A0ABU5VYU3_9BACT|nr:hypothetical protein [Bacteriovorax sp. PP10]MEA9358241.1 hypothetical protein [Bacteriovorax sp. PP10]
MSAQTTTQWINWFIYSLPYIMGVFFIVAVIIRVLIHFTVKRHEWFAIEFEKRVNQFVESQDPGQVQDVSFYVLSKKYLEKTYYEVFELRDRMQRRKPDRMMRVGDRVFLIKQGCAWLVKDILKQIKFLKWTQDTPKMLNITRTTFNHNPCFNRIFGIFPIGVMNDLVSILPGLFVVAGILGTFLGIRGGLTALGSMSVENLDATRKVMDHFLQEIAFAMGSSIVGITFSLMLHVINTIFNPDRVFSSMMDRFESALDLLWYRSDNNKFPDHNIPFNEHRDPSEALAEEAIKLETSKMTQAS